MDKKLLLSFGFSALLLMFCMNAGAVTHNVTASGTSFSPSTNFSVNVGDTVQWTWISGTHTTTSLTIPGGAATWDSPLSSSNTVFKYKVTVAGNYSFKCTPHFGFGMVGSFTASTVTGIEDMQETNLTTLYPNPFNNELFFDAGDEKPAYTEIAISDILGKQIRNISIENISVASGKNRIDVADLPKGIYFVTLKGSGVKAKTIRLVKEGA